jgi:menaquinone-specific isochorismate synthase
VTPATSSLHATGRAEQPSVPPESLVAWSVEVGDPGDLLSWLPAGAAFAFLRGGDGLVGWGEAARI